MDDIVGRGLARVGIVGRAGAVLLALAGAAGAQVSDVVGQQKVSQSAGGFGGALQDGDGFGSGVAALGDIDGDGLRDVAIGSGQSGNGAPGEFWVVRLGSSGVAGQQLVGSGSGGFTGTLVNGDLFGGALAGLGDLNGDGTPDIATGAAGDNDGAADAGALWLLRMNSDGSVKLHTKASSAGGYGGELHKFDGFGAAVASLGDLDGDGVVDVAVSAPGDDDGSPDAGAVWIVFLEPDSRVKGQQKISALSGNFGGVLHGGDHFGSAVAGLGDLDGDGLPDLVVGAAGDDAGAPDAGALWVLFLNADGTVKGRTRLAPGEGGFLGPLDGNDRFGSAAVRLTTGIAGPPGTPVLPQIAVGAPGDDDGGTDRGALWLLTLQPDGTASAQQKVSATQGGFAGVLHDGDAFGSSLADPGQNTPDDAPRLAVGAPGDDDGGAGRGAAWLLTFAGNGPPPVFTDFVNALAGRPGQPTLILPHTQPGDDFIGEPVVVVPGSTTGTTTLAGKSGRVALNATTSGPDSSITFGPTTEFATGSHPGQAANADFTGDGEADIVTPNTEGDSVSLLKQVATVLGPNSFAPHVDTTMPFDDAPVRLAPGHFNGDVPLDLAVAGSAGVTVFLNDGTGAFTPSDFRPVGLLTDLAVGDVDEDGRLDVITASGAIALGPGQEQGFASVLLGDGNGHLSAGGTFASGKAVASVLLADFDGDLHLDALLAIHERDAGPGGVPQATIRLFLGDGDGHFAESPDFSGFAAPNPDGVHPTYGSIADLDNDGRLDAVYTSSDNIAFAPGSFGAEQPPLTVTLLRNDGAGGFATSTLGTAYVGKGVAPLLQDLAPHPLDGNVDCILVWSQDTLAGQADDDDDSGVITLVAALVGDGQGSFFDPAPNHFLTGDEPGNPDVGEVGPALSADAPGDAGSGGPDLFVPSVKSNALTVLLGDGAGGTSGQVTVPDIDNLDPASLPAGGIWQGGPREVRTGQLDGDGLLDAVVYNEWDDLANLFSPVASLTLLRGDGTGHFTKTQYIPLARAGELALGDVLATPALDVLVTQRAGAGGPDSVAIFRGLGNGLVTTPASQLAVPAGLLLNGGLAVADTDFDNRREVVTSARASAGGAGRLIVYHNTGAALHAEVVSLPGSWSTVRSVEVGELTGDFLPDVAIGRTDGRLAVVAQLPASADADAHFAPIEISASAAALGGGALALGTLDGDGFLDIVSSNAATPGQIDQAFVRQLRGGGAGQFQVQTLPGLSSVGSQGSLRPLLTDMTGDGANDLVLVHGAAGLLTILPSALNTADEYGSGKPGKGGFTPHLSALGYTTVGGAITLRIDQAVGGAPSMLLIGAGKLPTGFLAVANVAAFTPLQLGGTPGTAGAGTLTLKTHMPNLSRYIGVEFALQLVVLDPAAGNPGPGKLSLSNGLALTMLP